MSESEATKLDVIQSFKSAVEWAQSASTTSKWYITLIILFLAGTALWVLWQKAPPKPEDNKSSSGLNNFTAATATAANVHGGTIAGAITGNATSTGQTGGVIAGTYINQSPPATEQEKSQALFKLQAEIEDLAEFPNRLNTLNLNTNLQNALSNKYPHQLYAILSKYYGETIGNLPKMHTEVTNFKNDYYIFEIKEFDIENKIIEEIGEKSTNNNRNAWIIYLKYYIFRTLNLTQGQIKAGGNFLNYGITWDDAENMFVQLQSNSYNDEFLRNAEQSVILEKKADAILEAYKTP